MANKRKTESDLFPVDNRPARSPLSRIMVIVLAILFIIFSSLSFLCLDKLQGDPTTDKKLMTFIAIGILVIIWFVMLIFWIQIDQKYRSTTTRLGYINASYKIALNTSSVSEFLKNYDDVLSHMAFLHIQKKWYLPQDFEEKYQTIRREFQWRLRDAIDRMKTKIIYDCKHEFVNSPENKSNLYTVFADEIKNASPRFIGDETWQLAQKDLDKVFAASGAQYPFHNEIFTQKNPKPNPLSITEIDNMEGHKFEYWCADLLRNNGFENVKVTPGSGDQGVDILCVKDGIKYGIQCKNYSGKLSNTPVQEISAGKAFYGCHVGVVMTNNYFTPGAIELAEKTGVLLWDRDKLALMISK